MSQNYAFLIVTGSPDHTEFGIDLLAIDITEEFRGIKLIPVGPHFVYSSSRDRFGNPSASRSGFFHYFKAGEILVKEWEPTKEELQNRSKGNVELEKQRISENLKNLDRFLAIYDYEHLGRWKNLTNLLSEEALKFFSPDCGIIRSAVEYKSLTNNERQKGRTSDSSIRNVKIRRVEDEEMYLPQMEVINDAIPKYSKLPERYNKNSPSATTINNIDTINLIETLLDEISSENRLLEEIQFCFIMYLCGLSVESLAHWRQIISLICNSEKAVEKYQCFYKQFIKVIQYQIPEIPIEFIEQSSTNTIYLDVKCLLRNLLINDCKDISDVLQKHLNETISWTFEDLLEEDPEDLPQIVEIDE